MDVIYGKNNQDVSILCVILVNWDKGRSLDGSVIRNGLNDK